MNIAILSPDVPFPANRGGRVDIWRRILSLIDLGHTVLCIHCASNDAINSEVEMSLDDKCVSIGFKPTSSAFDIIERISAFGVLPLHVLRRSPTTSFVDAVAVRLRSFMCEMLVLEGPWLGALALQISTRLGIPMVYRSHNIEHVYMRRQALLKPARAERIVGYLGATLGLRAFEERLISNAIEVWDISYRDSLYWASRGHPNVYWLPPLADRAPIDYTGSFDSDLLYVGNLRTPNNVHGLLRLIDSIFPRVKAELRDVTLTIVGSNPSLELRSKLASVGDVRLVCDVQDVRPFLHRARVLVNPVEFGGGVQLKTVDMLMTDCPIVVSPQGLSGLSDVVRETVSVATNDFEFADLVVAAYSQVIDKSRRELARSSFSATAMEKRIRSVQAKLAT